MTVAVRAADTAPAPLRTVEGIGSDLDDLEALIAHLEKNGGTWDETQRASAYANLLGLAENIGIALHRQRDLLNTAIGSQPKNDPNGGLAKTVIANQKSRMVLLNKMDARLKALRARIEALDPAKKAPAAKGGAKGGAKGTTLTPAGGK